MRREARAITWDDGKRLKKSFTKHEHFVHLVTSSQQFAYLTFEWQLKLIGANAMGAIRLAYKYASVSSCYSCNHGIFHRFVHKKPHDSANLFFAKKAKIIRQQSGEKREISKANNDARERNMGRQIGLCHMGESFPLFPSAFLSFFG